MDLRLLYSIFLTLMPVTELRAGLPLAIIYAVDKNIPIFWIFLLIVSANIAVIFFIFYFLDNLHNLFMKIKFYEKNFEKIMPRYRKKAEKFEKKYEEAGFLALLIFVAVPLPGTGVWTASIISWLLNLDRKKSILAISAGVFIAGIIVLLGTLGFISLFS